MATKKTTLKSWEEVDKALLEIGKNESFIQKKEAEMNKMLQEIRDRFETVTNEPKQKNVALMQDIEQYCIQNKDEFEKTKSRDLMHGKVGFRFGTPKVVLLNRKYNWDTVLLLLKKIFDTRFIRPKFEVNKDEILSQYSEKKLFDEELAGVGLKVDQDEKFYYEIKWEEIK